MFRNENVSKWTRMRSNTHIFASFAGNIHLNGDQREIPKISKISANAKVFKNKKNIKNEYQKNQKY